MTGPGATYRDLMTAIVRRFMVLLGARTALDIARRVASVDVSNDGSVSSHADLATLGTLVRAYKTVGGTLSVHFMRKEIAPLLEGNELPLPEELKG